MVIRLIRWKLHFPDKKYLFHIKFTIMIIFKKVLRLGFNVILWLILEMKLTYFDLVMLNCPTSPPPPPAEAGGEGGEPKDEPAEG